MGSDDAFDQRWLRRPKPEDLAEVQRIRERLANSATRFYRRLTNRIRRAEAEPWIDLGGES